MSNLYRRVYGVKKGLGDWEGDQINVPTEPYNHPDGFRLFSYGAGSDACDASTPITSVISILNTYGNFGSRPSLTCFSVGGDGSSGSGGTPDVEYADSDTYFACLWDDAFEDDFLDNDFFEITEGCSSNDEEPGAGGTSVNNWGNIHAVTFTPIKFGDTTLTPITILIDDFVDIDGVFTGYNYNLEAGLYSVVVIYKNGLIVDFISNASRTVNHSKHRSDFFEATVYPSPIIGSSYSIDVFSKFKTGIINYELYSPSMVLLYDSEFSLDPDIEDTMEIELENNIEERYVIHKFIFEDESEVRFITTVN